MRITLIKLIGSLLRL